MKTFKIFLSIFALLSLWLHMSAAEQTPAGIQQKFKEALKTADRLVLTRTEWDKAKNGEPGNVGLEIKGTDVIASLGETIDIKEFDMECLCYESPEMHFYRGDSYLFSLTLHHCHRLRGRDAVWGGDAVLTDQSAEKFRAWFAQHGYDGFVKGYEKMTEAIAADRNRKDKFLEIFPQSVRSLFPTDEGQSNLKTAEQKHAQFSAQYADHVVLVLDCWRGLGESSRAYGQGWERELQDFLRDILNSLTVDNLRAALERLPADEERAWIGAYRYYERPGFRDKDEIAKAFSEDWLARLAERVLPPMSEYEQVWIIQSLAERPAAATNGLLLKIAESDPLILRLADEKSELPSLPKLSNALHAILALAKNRIAECRPIISRRLAESTDPNIRLALEVALAQFDGPTAIGTSHLQCQIDEVAELAWRTVTEDPTFKISIDTLAVLAAKSKSYRVQNEAAKALEKLGLRVIGNGARADAILAEPRFKKAKTMSEIESLLADYEQTFANRKADEAERRVLAVLTHRKGLLLLQAGEYEKAAPLLMGGEVDSTFYADRAFALQTLGHFDDANSSLGRSVEIREEEAMKARLVKSGYLAFAQGHFEYASANFAAAKTVNGYLRDQGPVTLIQYLSELLTGKKPKPPSIQRIWIEESGFGESEELPADAAWPDTASFFLRGELPETEVFARIEKQKGRKEENLCEAHFFFSVLSRAKSDSAEEMKHLQEALDTKAFTTQCFSLATLRFREIRAAKKGANH